ncbi:MAG: DUF11 domain-containing protein [Leptolyngbya sp. SIO4C1]|nr:DUF11 domain-containing protein [Leptolyngbya sp. SIO4C1]
MKLGAGFFCGMLLSLLLNYQLSPMLPSMAQAVPNTASAQFDPASGPRSGVIPSNTVEYQTGVVLGIASLEITKTADKAAAEPGDVVIYRVRVTNNSGTEAAPLTVRDLLPRGIQYVEESATGVPSEPTSVTVEGSQLVLQFDSLPAGESLDIFYAATLTPDAIRGSGRNVAQAEAPGFPTADAAFELAIRPGILSDCGTIIGRVFVDKNFDGEQQTGEPGVPNAVIFLDDGNRIITDPDGLFSMANVVSGNRVGALDLSSLPGYTLAPNLYRISENSQSRLVRLEPGGLARMNFAVTPTFGEGES